MGRPVFLSRMWKPRGRPRVGANAGLHRPSNLLHRRCDVRLAWLTAAVSAGVGMEKAGSVAVDKATAGVRSSSRTMTGVTSAMAYIPYVQDRPEEGKAGSGLRDGMMKPDKDQPPPDRNDPRYIARRVFKALCGHYPDRYIALIEQPPPPKAPAPHKPTTL
jgi:hypothetical protein